MRLACRHAVTVHNAAQIADEQRVAWLEEQLAAASLDSAPAPPRLRQGQLCAAKFSLDQRWYRAKVLTARTGDPTKPTYDVSFVDFGNRETGLGKEAVRELEAAVAAVPAQAHPASLACLQVEASLSSSAIFAVVTGARSMILLSHGSLQI